MTFLVNGFFTGSEIRTSKKTGKDYSVVMFVSGLESLVLMVKEDCTLGSGLKNISDLKQFQPYTFSLDFNVHYNQMTISGISLPIPADSKK